MSLAAGSGRVVRRASVLFFDPTGENQDLTSQFDGAASDREAIDRVKAYLVDSEFQSAPLVVVSWAQNECELLMFGEVEVHTSAPAAPMVSGAGSSTWVERRLGSIELGASQAVHVWSGADVDALTNLVRGVVAAGGFRMSLDLAASEATTAPVAASPSPPPPPSPPPSPPAPSAVDQEMPEPPTLPADAPELQDLRSPEVSEPIAVPQPGLVAEVSDPFAGSSKSSSPGFDPDDSITEAAPVSTSDPFGSEANGEPADERLGLIEAATCSRQHANPPRRASCYVCGEEFAEDQSLRLIAQPAVGRIVFGNGQAVPLERAVILGRKPDGSGRDAHPVVIDHEEVSRSHALITIEGWTVLLTDQGSRNGTWVSPPTDPTPVRLDERVPHVLEHGTTVHLGAPAVSLTYYFDSQ